MRLVVCSLIIGGAQSIAPAEYVPIRFPFDDESYDPDELHSKVQPDTLQVIDASHPRASLIWPKHDAWAQLNGLIYLDAGDYSEVRTRFVRDPLSLTTGANSTCTEDHAPTPGGQYIAKNWNIFVHPLTPVALLIKHNAPRPVNILHAQFKLSYWVND